MAESVKSKTIYKLTQEQFDTLKAKGEITVGGVTYPYEPGNAMVSYVVSSASSGGGGTVDTSHLVKLKESGKAIGSATAPVYVDADGYAQQANAMPTKVSDLENDSNYATEEALKTKADANHNHDGVYQKTEDIKFEYSNGTLTITTKQ